MRCDCDLVAHRCLPISLAVLTMPVPSAASSPIFSFSAPGRPRCVRTIPVFQLTNLLSATNCGHPTPVTGPPGLQSAGRLRLVLCCTHAIQSQRDGRKTPTVSDICGFEVGSIYISSVIVGANISKIFWALLTAVAGSRAPISRVRCYAATESERAIAALPNQ